MSPIVPPVFRHAAEIEDTPRVQRASRAQRATRLAHFSGCDTCPELRAAGRCRWTASRLVSFTTCPTCGMRAPPNFCVRALNGRTC